MTPTIPIATVAVAPLLTPPMAFIASLALLVVLALAVGLAEPVEESADVMEVVTEPVPSDMALFWKFWKLFGAVSLGGLIAPTIPCSQCLCLIWAIRGSMSVG
jgi:hypothetical protein